MPGSSVKVGEKPSTRLQVCHTSFLILYSSHSNKIVDISPLVPSKNLSRHDERLNVNAFLDSSSSSSETSAPTVLELPHFHYPSIYFGLFIAWPLEQTPSLLSMVS